MKRLLSLLVAVLVSAVCLAQSTLVATRTHGRTVHTYSGRDALQKALAEANSGDVITLSNGQFDGGTITKNVTLKGMGFRVNTKEGEAHGNTIIASTLKLDIPETETGKLKIEGLYLKDTMQYITHITKAEFEKCRFNSIRYFKGAVLDHCTFLHCRIASCILVSPNSNVTFSNCVVYEPLNAGSPNSSCEFINCFVDFLTNVYWKVDGVQYNGASTIRNSVYRNCIIYAGNNNSYYPIPSSCTATYCIGYYNMFGNFPYLGTNTYYNSYSGPFSSYSFGDGYSDSQQYLLSDAAKAKHIGSDGTEIGIHGGALPYTEDPVRPKIVNVRVSKNTNAQEHLPVMIQIKDATY